MIIVNADILREEMKNFGVSIQNIRDLIFNKAKWDKFIEEGTSQINIKPPEEVERILRVITKKPVEEYSYIVENWVQLIFYFIGRASIFKAEDFEERKDGTR